MPRIKNQPAADVQDVVIDEPKFANAMATMREESGALTLATAQQDSAVRAVAQQLGYQLPADATDPDLIQRDIAANMRRSVEACLEVGRGLCVLKAACEHGGFMARLEVLGIEDRLARRFMQSAVKFTKRASTPVLKAAGSQTKLFELLVLDDEQLEELELTGQTGELSLDDVATMSVKELRAALREERSERQADRDVLAKRAARIEKLERDKVLLERQGPDEELKRLQTEAGDLVAEIRALINGALRQAVIAFTEGGSTPTAAGLVGQVHADLVALRDEFMLPDVSGETPEWQKWADAQDAARAAAAEH